VADERKLAADRSPVDPEIVPEDDSRALDNGDEAGAGAQQRRLAGAVRPRQEHHLTGSDVEVDAREGGEASEQADGGSEVDGEAHASGSRVPGAGSNLPRRPAFSSTFREALDAAGQGTVDSPPRPRSPRAPAPDPDQVEAEALADASARASQVKVPRPEPAAPRRRLELASILSVTGRTLIALGLLVLGFVAFELLGTNVAEARNQSTLREQLVAPPPPIDLPVSRPVAGPAPPPPPIGSAVAQIRIPRIGLDKAVVEGVDMSDLRKGPGHYANTPLPGQPGNSAIAGHRTTYGAPFFRLDEMQPGDPIFVSTAQGAFRYEVRQVFAVKPTQVEVLNHTENNQLTLTTCEPRFSAARRLVVVADLKGLAAAGPALPDNPNPAVAAGIAAQQNAERAATVTEVVGASGDPTERVPAALWGSVVVILGIAGAVLGRLWRRLPAWLLTAVLFLPALWNFYSHLAKAVPS
jgi:sortase A